MSHNTGKAAKTIGISMAAIGAAAAIGGAMMGNRSTMAKAKKSAGKMAKSVSGLIDDVRYMMK